MILEKAERKVEFGIQRVYLEMEEVALRIWAGINLKDSFLQSVRNGGTGFYQYFYE